MLTTLRYGYWRSSESIGAIAIPWRIEIRWSGSKKDSLLSLSSLSSRDICPSFLFLGGRGRASQTDTRRGSCCCENVLLTPVDGRQILARCWCNGGSCSNGVNGGGRSSLRTFNVGSCCIGSRCDILPGERRTVNRGLRRFFWNPLQQQLQTDVSSSSDIVSPWFPTWPDSIEPFAVITSPSRRTAPCAACVIQQFPFFFPSFRQSFDTVWTRFDRFRMSSKRVPGFRSFRCMIRPRGGLGGVKGIARGSHLEDFLVLIRGARFRVPWRLSIPTLCDPASRATWW